MGVDLGGQTPEQAQTSLTEVLDSFDNRPIELRFQDLEWQRRGGEFGLKRDVAPLVESAFNLGRDGNLLSQLVQQLSLWRTGRNIDSVGVLYDAAIGRAFVEGLAGEVNRPVIDARPGYGRTARLSSSRLRLAASLTSMAPGDASTRHSRILGHKPWSWPSTRWRPE